MDVFGAAGNGRGAWGGKWGCGGGGGGGEVESLLHAVYMTPAGVSFRRRIC